MFRLATMHSITDGWTNDNIVCPMSIRLTQTSIRSTTDSTQHGNLPKT